MKLKFYALVDLHWMALQLSTVYSKLINVW